MAATMFSLQLGIGTRAETHVEPVIFSTKAIEEEMPIHLDGIHRQPSVRIVAQKLPTCGLIKTRSMNSTTKSCSTYLSPKRLHRGHCVRRTPLPEALSSALL